MAYQVMLLHDMGARTLEMGGGFEAMLMIGTSKSTAHDTRRAPLFPREITASSSTQCWERVCMLVTLTIPVPLSKVPRAPLDALKSTVHWALTFGPPVTGVNKHTGHKVMASKPNAVPGTSHPGAVLRTMSGVSPATVIEDGLRVTLFHEVVLATAKLQQDVPCTVAQQASRVKPHTYGIFALHAPCDPLPLCDPHPVCDPHPHFKLPHTRQQMGGGVRHLPGSHSVS